MASRNELAVRARNVGLDHTAYANDSKLAQKVLWLEKNGSTFSGTLATGVLTSNNTNVSDADTVTIGGQTYTFKTALGGLAASSTLTSSGTTPTTGDSVTVEGQTYTFRTTLSAGTNTGSPYEVLINGSAANALTNLKKAINASGVAGTDYGVGTAAHPLVTAGTLTSTTLLVSAKVIGTAGNNFLTSTVNAGTLSWTGTNLTGGTAQAANQIFIGASADASLTNLVSAINGTGTAGTDYDATTPVNKNVSAGAVGSHATTVTAKDYANTNADVATTKSAATLSWGATTLAGGVLKQIAVDNTTVNGSPGLSGDADV